MSNFLIRAIFLAILFITSPSWALRCNNTLITEGTPTYIVLKHCNVVDQSIEHMFVLQNGMLYDLRITNATVNYIEEHRCLSC